MSPTSLTSPKDLKSHWWWMLEHPTILQAVGDELERLVKGTLEPVDYAEWAAPIVAVLKSDRKSVRICGDFHMTVNPVSKLNRYPLPMVEDLF